MSGDDKVVSFVPGAGRRAFSFPAVGEYKAEGIVEQAEVQRGKPARPFHIVEGYDDPDMLDRKRRMAHGDLSIEP